MSERTSLSVLTDEFHPGDVVEWHALPGVPLRVGAVMVTLCLFNDAARPEETSKHYARIEDVTSPDDAAGDE